LAEKPAIGFGVFLLGLSLGWLVFSSMIFSSNVLAILLIIIGGSMILSGVLQWVKLTIFSNLVGGAMGGLIIALLLTQGFNIVTSLNGTDFSFLPYSASQNTRLTGSLIESSIIFKSQNINGPVTIQTWDKDEYEVKLFIKAKGASQSEADKHLSQFKAEIKKNVQSEGAVLELSYSYPNVKNPPYEISVEVMLPAKVSIDVDSSSTNGSIMLANIQGINIKVYTSNGLIQLNNIKIDVFNGKTSNGAVRGDIDATNCSINTSNSPIDLKISLSQSGKYSLSTSNGQITIVTTKPAGYTLDTKTSNGNINLNLPNLDYSVNTNTHKSASTHSLENYPLKIMLEIQTSNGNIEVSTISSGSY
jgi:DUF4097 and DUF4098 domain-containing protein YvlB